MAWNKYEKKGSNYVFCCWHEANKRFCREQGLEPIEIVHIIRKDLGQFNYRTKDMERIGRHCLRIIRSDTKIIDKWKKTVQSIEALCEKLEKTEFSSLSIQELAQLEEAFWEEYVTVIKDGLIPDHIDDVMFDEIAKHVDKGCEDFHIITTPDSESNVIREEKDFIQLLDKGEQDIRAHLKRYFWMGGDYAISKPYDMEYLKMRIKQAREGDHEAVLSERIRKYEDLVQKRRELLEKRKDLRPYAKILDDFTRVHEQRKMWVIRSLYSAEPLFDEMAKRLGTTGILLRSLAHDDLQKAIKEGIPKLEERYKTSASWSLGDEEERAYGELAIMLAKKHKVLLEAEGDMVRGICASKGEALGPAKIIMSNDDFHKFHDQDILITSMTSPDFSAILSKAAAIVTDEGGITSHAAIISRELGIPCVIATGNATRTFKDGDSIELEADAGVVRKR